MSKCHLLTGATSGIGKEISQCLRENGDAVIPVLRNQESAEAMDVSEYLIADFSDPISTRKAFRAFERKVDSFINCAGIAVGKPIWENSPEEVSILMNVNLISPMAAIAEIHRQFKKNSTIILFSSKSAFSGGWDDIYIASKGGINSLVKSLSLKFAPEVRVIGIAPGVTTATRMTNERKADDLKQVINSTPLNRLTETREISDLVMFLLENPKINMTGIMIDVNGGAYLR